MLKTNEFRKYNMSAESFNPDFLNLIFITDVYLQFYYRRIYIKIGILRIYLKTVSFLKAFGATEWKQNIVYIAIEPIWLKLHLKVCACVLSHGRLFVTPRTVAH